jgi:hypothetical protein
MLGGKFQDFFGIIKVDRAKPEVLSVEFTIKVDSIFTNDAKRDAHLKFFDFFDVLTHPTITFRSTSIKANGKDGWLVTGDLTMRGDEAGDPPGHLPRKQGPWGNDKMGFDTWPPEPQGLRINGTSPWIRVASSSATRSRSGSRSRSTG